MERMLQDPERLRRKAETEARLQEIKAAKDEIDNSEKESLQQLEVATLALREVSFRPSGLGQLRMSRDRSGGSTRSIT